jgi:cellulose synthase/poly-beta-1,6-N-acetylglucosamine synthase-like glycosyltransferase
LLGAALSDEVDLVRAIVGSSCGEREADEILASSQALGVDPLVYLGHRLGPAEVAVRAAEWAGVETAASIPDSAVYPRPVDHVDHLGEAKTFRARFNGRDVVYCAPPIGGLIALREHFAKDAGARRNFCLVPPQAIRRAYARAAEDSLLESARYRLARNWPGASALVVLGGSAARTAFVFGLFIVLALVVAAPFFLQPVIVPIVGVLLIVPALLKLVAVALKEPDTVDEPPLLSDEALPVYTVLIPLRDEAQMVPQLRRAMEALDYPREKLQVLFVVEAKSVKTVAAVERILADPRFELLTVPDSLPRTKPKAINYALPFVRGAHVVVYDAEDVPDPDQLRKAASAFAADRSIDCLQAELVVDNASESLLAALFAGEYAGQFGLMLPLLSRWRLPMPLGGTSNHFLTRSIREVGGWDAYNVTEDADLGVRLARFRYRTATLRSQTHEEAPLGFKAWMAQRTRWMKGWMQTFVVHSRKPFECFSDMGWTAYFAFQVYVGSMIVSALLHTVFLVSLAASIAFDGLRFPDTPWGWANVAILAAGYSGAFAIVLAGLKRLGAPTRVVMIQLLMPLYWVLHTIAAARAAYELFARPYYWAKTVHGRTKVERRIGKRQGFGAPVPVVDRIEPVFSEAPGE